MARTSSGLGSWLASLSHEQMLALLRARPDATLDPAPANPSELAARLSTPHSVQQAITMIGRPALQVAEALLALGGQAPRTELARLLGAEHDAAVSRLDAAISELGLLGLLWPVQNQFRLAGSWRVLMPYPLALGGSGHDLFTELQLAQLRQIGSTLGLGGYCCKADWVTALVDATSDPGAVQARLASAPAELAKVVRKIAWQGPRVSGVRLPNPYERATPNDVGVALALHGWVVPTDWGGVGEMPCEVALAVRGPEYHAPFDAPPPRVAIAKVDPQRLHETSRHAAGAAVDAVRRLLSLLDRTPLAMLQAGGIGVRELRRAAKALPADEAGVRLWLEIAAAAGLAAPDNSGSVVPSKAADEWLDADPANALAGMLTCWWSLAAIPSHRVDESAKPAPALAWGNQLPGATQIRADILGELADLSPGGPGQGLADTSDVNVLAASLSYRRPIIHQAVDIATPRVRSTLAEATLLGLVADGALTPLGFQLLAAVTAADPEAVLAQAAAGLLPAPSATATFLPDLTVVVGGTVSPALSRLLDETADAESRDTASTWRFSTGSVRRALDGGRDADSLLAALAAVAENPLPQPLEYLIRDVARRHGELEVVPAGCCVVVADPGLAAEVAAHRKLAGLKLRLLGGSVLVSGKNAVETVAALRAAGYAPVRRDAGGRTVIERVPVRRADARRSQRPTGPGGRKATDLPALARRLALHGSRATD